jgi:anti-sigma B factor antagonist
MHERAAHPASIIEPEPGHLALEGAIDRRLAPRLRDQLRRSLSRRPPRLLINLTRATAIDSAALAVLIEAMERARSYGGRLILYGIHEPLQTVLHGARLDHVFPIFPNRQRAEQA